MDYFVIITFLFVSGSVLGWILELFYRRFISKANPERKWINPGFLTGPYLPLYGFGLVTLFIMARIPVPFIENEFCKKIVLFILMAIAMTVIEYIAGKIFIVGMKIQLWNYNDEWGNIEGIICPRFSFYWAVIGALYYFLIHPKVIESLSWLFNNLAYCLVIGFIAGIYTVDVFYSFHVSSKIRKFAVDNNIVVKYEELKLHIAKRAQESREKYNFIFAFRTDVSMKEHLKKYIEVYKSFK